MKKNHPWRLFKIKSADEKSIRDFNSVVRQPRINPKSKVVLARA